MRAALLLEGEPCPMGTFGDRLRREREMRGITLEEIAHSTKIGTRNLRALEDEEFHLLPGGIFNRGFVRAYAHFLGLDEEQCVADYSAALAEKEGPPPSSEQIEAEQEQQGGLFLGDYRITPLLILLGVVLVLVLGGWLGLKVYKSLHSDPDPVNAATTASDTTLQPKPLNSPEAVLGANANGPISVAIHFKQRCWIQVTADDKQVLKDNLAGGTEQQFSAQKTLKIIVGDVAAVELSYNGKPVVLQGTPGKAVGLSFTPAGYSLLRS